MDLSKTHDNFALFFEMGTGKTLSTIAALLESYNSGPGIQKTLVVAPIVVVPNWEREIQAYSDLPGHRVVTLLGSQKQRIKTFQSALDRIGKELIVITNYEALLMGDLFEMLMKWQPEFFVADESHKLKTYNTKRTKFATQLADKAGRKILLSGTPVLNSPIDLFSQYRVMDGGKTFGKSFYAFRFKYFYDKNAYMPSTVRFPNWQLHPDSIENINALVQETSLRVKKDECLDLPPLLRRTEYVEMTPGQNKLYQGMKKDFIAYLDDKACVASIALTKALRLMQILSGFIKLEDGTERQLDNVPRERALEDLLEQLTPNHKVIVWAVFKHNFKQIAKICEKLGLEYVEVHGGVTQKCKQEAIDRFTRDDGPRVFIGHPGAGGIGVNLTVSSYSIYFSRSFSLEHDLQSEARNHRGGSERHEKITRIDLVTPGTIDELVLKMLANKQELGENLISAIKREGI